MGEFWAPGAEIWLFKKKNMDRSIDLAVQHMFSSEDETFFFSMKIEDPDSPHSSESERSKIKWLVIWTSVRSLVLVTVFTSEVIRKKSSPKYFCQVVPLHHQPHMCNLLSDKVTYMAVCGMWTAGHLKWIARHNQNRKKSVRSSSVWTKSAPRANDFSRAMFRVDMCAHSVCRQVSWYEGRDLPSSRRLWCNGRQTSQYRRGNVEEGGGADTRWPT